MNNKVKTINLKKKPCDFYMKGICNKGENCTYSHNIKQGTESICKFSISGSCNKTNCLFSHDLTKYPCKYYFVSGKCDNLFQCKFSHEIIKNENILKDFIKDNEKNIVNHINSKIMTPLNRYVLEKKLINYSSEFNLLEDDNNKFINKKEEINNFEKFEILDFNPFN